MNIFDENGNRKPRPDTDRIRLSQGIEAREARTGEPSPQRLLAERAVEAIRASSSPDELRERCSKANCTVVIEDTLNQNGKIKYTGFVKAGDGTGLSVKLSALPQDCRAWAIMKRFDENEASAPRPVKALTANQAKFHGRAALKAAEASGATTLDAFLADAGKRLAEKGMSIERQGKTGAYLRFAEGDEGRIKLSALGGKYTLSAFSKKFNAESTPNAPIMHGSQSKVNASSMKSASTFADRAADRASSANDRAVSVAAEGVQARTIAEALDDAQAQAVALDTARRAKAQADKAKEQAAVAEKRAQEAEAREAALRQKIQETTDMNSHTPQPTPAPEKTIEKTMTNTNENLRKPENPSVTTAETEKALKTQNSVNANGENAENAEERPMTLAERVAEARKRGAFGNTIGPVPTGIGGARGAAPGGHHGPKM